MCRKQQFLTFTGSSRAGKKNRVYMRVLRGGLGMRMINVHTRVYSLIQITYERSLREALIFTCISRAIRRKISCTYN